jgi:hypothetical protein
MSGMKINRGALPLGGSPRIAYVWRFFKSTDITDYAITGTGSPTAPIADAAGGAVTLTPSASNDDSCQIQTDNESWKFDKLNEWYHFEFVLQVAEVTDIDLWFGLCTRDTDIINSKPNDRIGWGKDDDDAYLDVETMKNGSGNSSTNVGTLTTANARYRIAVRTFGTAGYGDVYFYRNGILLKTIPNATVVDDEELCISVAVQNGSAGAKTLTLREVGFDVYNPSL